MLRWAFRLLGVRALKSAVSGGRRPPLLDFGLGFSLFRDRRVAVSNKAVALLLGMGALVVLTALELPVEAIIAALLNLPGIGLDMVIEGVEIIAGPLLFASLFLTRLAPREIVERIRAERYGVYTVEADPAAPQRPPAPPVYRRA